jgi:NADPH:quinone reductase-like Zn-dependent oxidoreductase
VTRTGGPEVLQLVEDEVPIPGVGQVRVKVLAADIGFSDVNVRRGRYPGGPRPPFTPGYAMVGIVDDLGPETTGVLLGQPVGAVTLFGSYSQYLVLPAHELSPIPHGIDPAEAVVLVFNYVAAYQMLHRIARVARGQQVLVHGAAGGLGTAFLELARIAGLEVHGTASAAKHDLLVRLGATPIDYRSEDFVARIHVLTGGAGVDAAFDPMGFAHLQQSERAVRRGGSVVAYGYYQAANRGGSVLIDLARQFAWLGLWTLPPKRKRVAFYDLRPTRKRHPDWYADDLRALFDLLAAGKLRPVIAGRVPLADIVSAHERVERAEVEGRLVLTPNG